MTIAAGTTQYLCETAPVTGRGFCYSNDELDDALSGSVAEVLHDDSGMADIKALLVGLVETDFEKREVERILLPNTRPPEDWCVGEALAETYLAHHMNCFFPGRMVVTSARAVPACPVLIWLAFKPLIPMIFFLWGG